MIPTDLRKDAIELQKNVEWKDQGADGKYNFNLSSYFLLYY